MLNLLSAEYAYNLTQYPPREAEDKLSDTGKFLKEQTLILSNIILEINKRTLEGYTDCKVSSSSKPSEAVIEFLKDLGYWVEVKLNDNSVYNTYDDYSTYIDWRF